MFTDFIINGNPSGEFASTLGEMRYDPGLLRPYIETNPTSPNRGRPCVTINTGRRRWDEKQQKEVPIYNSVQIRALQERGINSPVFNATSLRKEEWIQMDRQIIKAARLRLRAWADLAAANTYGGFNGMGKTILEHETMSDPGFAQVDMDGLSEGRMDEPLFQLQGTPLPITHADFWFSARKLAISRNGGMPLDTVMGEAAGRRIAESLEKVTLGVETGLTYGGASTQVGGYGRNSTIYGYTNFSARLTKVNLYKPTGVGRAGSGWVPLDTLKDVLAMRDQLTAQKFYGPFMLYHSNDWDQYMDTDYILTGGNVATQTLRDRLRAIEGISDVRRLDFLSATASAAGDPANIVSTFPWCLLMVSMQPEVARAINGQDITTVQWESVGGMRVNFKVFCIQVPQLRADYYGNCGVLHANASSGV